MKKAFTLIELVVSITIFTILVTFLYKTLNETKHSNKLFEKKQYELEHINTIYDIFFEDILESKSPLTISKDRDGNSIVVFKSLNSFHNSFYNNISYLIDSKGKLVRIESKDIFKLSNTPYGFYENSYIDVLQTKVEYFEVVENKTNNSYLFIIKQKDKKRELFNILKPFNIETSSSSNNNSTNGANSE